MANESANATDASNTATNAEGNEVTVKLIDGVCVVTSEDATTSLTAPIVIEKPEAGEAVQLAVVPGQKYFFDFNENNVQSFIQEGEDLTLNFADGSSIALEGFGTAASGVLPATLAFSDALSADQLEGLIQVVDTTPDQETLEEPQAEVRETEETASGEDTSGETAEGQQVAAVEPASGDEPSGQDVAQIEPAAGEDGAGGNQNTGFGFGSSFDAQGVIGLEDVGPIDPTLLQYGVEFQNEDLLPQDEIQEDDDPSILSPVPLALDETFLGPLAVSDTLNVDFGNDGPGTITPGGTSSVGGSSVGGATLLSGGQPVDIQPTVDGYVGTINGGADTVFTLTIDPQTGFYEFTQILPIDHADDLDPNDVIELTFSVDATDSSGDVATADIVIQILDDAPAIAAPSSNTYNENLLAINPIVINDALVVDFGNDVAGTVTPGGTAAVTGVPALSSNGEGITITATPNGYIGTLDIGGGTAFELVIDPTNGSYVFTQNVALDHALPTDTITLDFPVYVTDFDGDTTQTLITVNITDSVPVFNDRPVIGDGLQVVDESDLPGVSVNGQLTVDFGTDLPGAVTANDTFGFSGSALGGNLTSNGDTVNVTLVGDTYIGHTGADPNLNQVFTLQVNTDGSYTFDLLGTLDHADPNDPNDIIDLTFGVVVTDADGDTDATEILVRVLDDVPTIGDSRGDVDESDLDGGPLSTSSTLVTSFGAELNTIAPDGNIATEASGNPIVLTSGGQPVDIQQTANGYEGTINGGADTVFTITIDPVTAQYVYTQFSPFEHPDALDANDTIELSFGVGITNNDGDSDNGTITISVADDGPIANDDVTGAEEGQSITGSVVANDELSEDTPNTVSEVEFGGNTFIIPDGGNSGPIVTPLGTLVLNSDGTYEFTATDIGDPDGTAVFTYTLVGFDGDSDTATLSVRVTPDGEPIAVTDSMTVDETNLPGGLIINETLPVDFGLDGPGSINPSGTTSFGGSVLGGNLSSGGQPVEILQTANGYEGVIQGTTVQVFELIVQDNGDYSFELFQTLDHADSTDPNDLIQLSFGITVADADNDTADGTIIINVLDDAPVAFDDGNTVLQNTLVTTGDVVANDIQGEDTPSTVTSISFTNAGGTTTIPVVAGVATSITGDYGTLEINADGTYEYTSFGTNIITVVDEFTYNLTDFDGDTDTAELTITIRDIDTKPKVSAGFEVVDETDLPGVQESGQLVVDYGADGPGEVLPNDTFTPGGSLLGGTLTSGGETVNITLVGDTYVGHIGVDPNLNQVFTLEVNTDGSYTFDLLGTLDHADPNDPNDIITLEFGVNAVDSDQDATPSTILINVLDDVPTIGNQVGDVDESDFDNGPISTSNTLFTDFGTEATSFTPDGGVRAEVGGNPIILTSGGEQVVFAQTADGYEGTINGGADTVFTLTMNPATGQYEYTQFAPFDHPDDTDPDDVINLFFDFTVVNTDGDAAAGTVQIDVADDGPVANDDLNGVAEGQDITGNVVANDELSEDTPNTVTEVEFGGNTFAIPAGGDSGPIVTPLGTLVLNSDGTYTFDAVDSGDPDGTVTFTYTLQGGDLDTDTANLSIRVTPNGEPIIVSGENLVDETALTPGPVIINETLAVNFGADGAGTLTPNGTSSFGGSATAGNLTSNDVPVEIRATTNGYEGVLAGTDTQVFELIVQDNGDYSFELFGPLDHADGSDPNDAIQLNFGVTATDFGGDAASATITINVLDDAPIANDDMNTYDTTFGVANGNVITGLNGGAGAADDLSEDNAAPESADHDVVEVSFNGTTVTIPEGGSNTIEGDFGILTMFDDGTYSYELKPGVTLPGTGGTSRLDPTPADVAGNSDTLTKNGITVTGLNSADNDLRWVTDDGSGIGLAGGSDKVWPSGEALNVSFALAENVVFTITDIGSNNLDDGIDFIVRFADGTSTTFEYDIGANGPVIDKTITVEFDSADYGDKLMTSIEVTSVQNSNLGPASFLLNDVEVTHPGVDCLLDQFEYVLQDGDGDQSTAVLTLKGKDLTDDQPKLTTSKVTVDETDLDPTDDDSNSISADFGGDGPGSYALLGLDSFTGATNSQLTSNGVDVLVTNEGGDLVGRANGDEVFRLELNEANGQYTFTLTGVLDHADATDPDDNIELYFEVAAIDNNGDRDTGLIEVCVKDDGPFINSKAKPIDEDGLVNNASISYTHTLQHSYGEDGQGEIRPTDNFQAKYQVGGPNQTLMAGGFEVVVSETADGYEGIANGETVFTLVVQNNGQYTYTQFKPIDHPDGTNPDDVIWLKFGVEIVDYDGDTDQATIIVDLHDGGPHAVNDVRTLADDQLSLNGDVIANDQVGPDVEGSITSITFGAQTEAVVPGVATSIDGDYGTLEINADGTYTYTTNNTNTGAETDVFGYTLSDFDGDTDTAHLTINLEAVKDLFIVGENVDDVDGEQTPWIVGGGTEEILGGVGNDVLVGDAGGAKIVNQDQDYNFVYVLDRSGSMGDNDSSDGRNDKIEILIDAVKSQMNQFAGYQNGQIKVHLVAFAENVKSTFTVDFASATALADVTAYLDGLDGDGLTNYEAPLQSANEWLAGSEPLGGDAITTTYFISDGEPNRHLNDNGGVVNPPGNDAEEDAIIRAEITGTTVVTSDGTFGDDSDEVGTLQSLSDDVVAVGVDVANNQNLNLIDSDGSATYIDDPNDLMAVLAGNNPLNQLAAAGGDFIEGGARHDLIFGDVLNTDQLASDQGLPTTAGAGWEVFAALENGEGSDAGWSRTDTLNYIRGNAEELATESVNSEGQGRSGGDDVIAGGAGNDTIFGQEGDDVIIGGAGDDTLYGGSGADAFLFESIDDGVDTVKDFDVAEGDVLDVSALLVGFDALQDSINDFVFTTEVAGDTVVSVDENGSGNIANATQIAVLESVTGLSIEDATNNGQTTV